MVKASEAAAKLCSQRSDYVFNILNNLELDAVLNNKNWLLNAVDRARKRLYMYFNCLHVHSYNGSAYDLPTLIKQGLCYYIAEEDDTPMAIKSSNRYISICSSKLNFLDVLSFCEGKAPLRSFLRTWGDENVGEKLFFPYSALRNREDLLQDKLPIYGKFYSNLSQSNVLEEEYDKYDQLLKLGLSKEDVLKKLKLKKRPNSGSKNYAMLLKIWQENKCHYLFKFLLIYNHFDIKALLHTILNMTKYWRRRRRGENRPFRLYHFEQFSFSHVAQVFGQSRFRLRYHFFLSVRQ